MEKGKPRDGDLARRVNHLEVSVGRIEVNLKSLGEDVTKLAGSVTEQLQSIDAKIGDRRTNWAVIFTAFGAVLAFAIWMTGIIREPDRLQIEANETNVEREREWREKRDAQQEERFSAAVDRITAAVEKTDANQEHLTNLKLQRDRDVAEAIRTGDRIADRLSRERDQWKLRYEMECDNKGPG